jgi:HEAT repeat protein
MRTLFAAVSLSTARRVSSSRAALVLLPLVLLPLGAITPAQETTTEGTAPDLSSWITDLGDSEAAKRRDAAWEIEQLTRRGVPDADLGRVVEALGKASGDRDPQVSVSALTGLAKLGPRAASVVPTLIERLGSRGQTGYRAAAALGRVGPAAYGPLEEALRSRDSTVRRHAAVAFGFTDPKGEPPLGSLVAAIVDDNDEVSGAAIESLATLGAASVPALAGALSAEKPPLRRGALRALAEVGVAARGSGDAVLACLEDPDPATRALAVQVASRFDLGSTALRDRLVTCLADTSEEVRSAAVETLSRFDPESVLPVLIPILESGSDPVVVGAAASIVGAHGPTVDSAVPALIGAVLRLDDEPAVTTVARGIEAAGAVAVPALVGALADPRANGFRERALVAAIAFQGSAAVGVLTTALDSGPESARSGVIRALGAVGSAASDALPALGKIVDDETSALRALAAGAIGNIDVDARTARLFLVRLDDPDPELRSALIGALPRARDIDSAVICEALARGLRDEQAGVRRTAAAGFVTLDARAASALGDLMAALGDTDPEVLRPVVRSLGRIGPPAVEAAPRLVDLLADLEGPVAAEIAWTLGRFGPVPGAVSVLERAVREAPLDVRLEALASLGAMGTMAEPAFSAVLAVLDGAEKELHAPALKTLTRIAADRTRIVSKLASLVESGGGSSLRKVAIETLGELGTDAEGATPVLFQLLDDRYQRALAFETLRKIGPRSTAVLRTGLEHSQRFVRVFACERVGAIGEDGRELWPLLEVIANDDDDGRVRKSAADALKAAKRSARAD